MTSLIGDSPSAFLVHAASLEPRAELLSALQSQIGGSDEWDELLFYAKRNRVAGLILRNLDQLTHKTIIPETARTALRQLAALVADRYPSDLRNLASIHAAFSRAQIPYVLFKGAALVETLYRDPSLRPFADYDLLVERDRVSQAAALLEQIGYTSSDPLSHDYYLRFHLHLTFLSKNPRAFIDLHWCCVGPYDLAQINYDMVIRRACPSKAGSLPNPVPSPVDQILLNAIHLHKHLGYLQTLLGHPDLPRHVVSSYHLINLCDFVRLLHHHAATDLADELSNRMRCWNVVDKVQFCALLCRALWGEDDGLAPLLQGLRVERSVSGRVLARFLTLVPQLSHKSSRVFGVTPTRLLTLLSVFFPDRESLRRYYSAPSALALSLRRIAHPLRMGLLMGMNILSCAFGWARIITKTGAN